MTFMNDKIKELHIKTLDESANMRWNIEDSEKFAELIVRECADAAEEAVSHAIFNTTMHDNDIPNYVRAKVENIFEAKWNI